MADPSPTGFISLLWRLSLALLVAALVLDFTTGVLRCAWPWIVGTAGIVGLVALVVRWLRSRRSGW